MLSSTTRGRNPCESALKPFHDAIGQDAFVADVAGEEMKMRKVRVDMVIVPGTMIMAPGISLRIEASRPRATRAASRSGGYHTLPAGRRTAKEGKRQTSSLHAIAHCGHHDPRGLARRERAHSEKTSDSDPAEVTEWPPEDRGVGEGQATFTPHSGQNLATPDIAWPQLGQNLPFSPACDAAPEGLPTGAPECAVKLRSTTASASSSRPDC